MTIRGNGMSSLENRVRAQGRRVKIQDALLLMVYGTVGITLALTAPNALSLLRNLGSKYSSQRNVNQRISQTIGRLVTRGLIRRNKRSDGTTNLVLTKAGERHAKSLAQIQRSASMRKTKWDGKWRIVIFDVWEKRRAVRDQLRNRLKTIGFIRVQNSVWVYPYDCEEILIFFRTELRLGKSALYIVAEGIENDTSLRKQFGLPLE